MEKQGLYYKLLQGKKKLNKTKTGICVAHWYYIVLEVKIPGGVGDPGSKKS